MKGKEWVTVIAIVFVVAVIASLITANITGNVIKVGKSRFGTEVYTKAEIDGLLRENSDENLDLFNNNCEVYSVSLPSETREVTGNDICLDRDADSECIFTISYGNINDAINGGNNPIGSNLGIIQSCKAGKFKSTETVAYCCRVD